LNTAQPRPAQHQVSKATALGKEATIMERGREISRQCPAVAERLIEGPADQGGAAGVENLFILSSWF
jgi:hypothetical protein